MKIIFLALALFVINHFSFAQSSTGEVGNIGKCAIDSFKTNKLNISTGIGIDASSDSVLMNSGYGYNTYYTTPNDNKDTLWQVARLSSNYNPRIGFSGFAYTGTYLKPGDHPSIIKINGTVLTGYYGAFKNNASCIMFGTPSLMASNWVSVYADAGGQNGGIENAIGDSYIYERCFYICADDTVSIDLQLLADDIVDTVKLDSDTLYVTKTPTYNSNFDCPKVISLYQTKILTAGRHTLKVWTRDNAGGHLGLNVYGHIKSAGYKKNIVRSKFDSRCNFDPTIVSAGIKSSTKNYEINISPNPNKGQFSISCSQNIQNGLIQIFDFSSRKIKEERMSGYTHQLNLSVAPGVYFVRFSSETAISVQKVIIE